MTSAEWMCDRCQKLCNIYTARSVGVRTPGRGGCEDELFPSPEKESQDIMRETMLGEVKSFNDFMEDAAKSWPQVTKEGYIEVSIEAMLNNLAQGNAELERRVKKLEGI